MRIARGDHGRAVCPYLACLEPCNAYYAADTRVPPPVKAGELTMRIPVSKEVATLARLASLDKLIVFGPGHLDHVVGEYLRYYPEERPHQGMGNVPLTINGIETEGEVVCRERLGGLLRHYYRRGVARAHGSREPFGGSARSSHRPLTPSGRMWSEGDT